MGSQPEEEIAAKSGDAPGAESPPPLEEKPAEASSPGATDASVVDSILDVEPGVDNNKSLPAKAVVTETKTDSKMGEHKFHPHQAKIFNELLEKTAPEVAVADGRTYKHPVLIDGLLALGLLVAMAGFTLGVIKIYIVHEAKHDINERRYPEAISILRSAPLPGLFQIEGESPEELLDQARYLEAIEKLDKDGNDQTAMQELDQIRPGSRFFEMANNIKGEHSPASPITLQGGADHEATAAEVNSAERPLLPESNDGHN